MEILEYLKHLHDECIAQAEHIRFDKRHPRHVHLIGLYGTLVELCGCLLALVEQKLRTGVPPIFRAIFEAYVEFKNLHAVPEYGYYMESSSAQACIKLLEEAKKGLNPCLADMNKLLDLDAAIAQYQTTLDTLKAKGFAPLSIFARFQRAGLTNEYRSLYNLLSTNAHSNINALVDRHIDLEGSDFTVVYYKDEPLERYVLYLDSTAGVLSDASQRMHEFFCTGQVAVFQQLNDELTQIRGAHPVRPSLPFNLDPSHGIEPVN
jgi:Family of unknown function (DUF5677)